MIRRLTLQALMALTLTICNLSDAAFALVGPTLYSPANGAYVDGSEITFTWSQIYGTNYCINNLSVCTDQNCNNSVYSGGSGEFNSTSLTIYPNLVNNGTKYYWKVREACTTPEADLLIYDSLIGNFSTYDNASNSTITTTPASPVIEGDMVSIIAEGHGAPLNDYLFSFSVDTFVNGNYTGSQHLQGPSTDSTCTWTAPAYEPNTYYTISVYVGTSSFANYFGSFAWDDLPWKPYVVLPSSIPVITTTSFPEAMDGAPYYTDALAVTGGQPPYTWSNISTGSTPTYIFPGISIDPNTGVISGTPTGWNESFPLTIQVKDSRELTATKDLTFVVHPPLSISPSYLPDVIFGTVYNQTLGVTGGKPPYSEWSISYGSLPAGLNLDRYSGTISGIPIGLGNFPFSVKISDSLNASIEKPFAIYVYPPLSISTSSLLNGTVGSPYNQTLTATGGYPGSNCWSIYSGNWPAGLTLSSSGVISGTPLTANSYTFIVQVGSACQFPAAVDRRQYTINVFDRLSISTNTLPSGTVGSSYNQILSATGGNGTYTWTIASGNIPPGLNLSPGGVISGTPSDGGRYTFTAQVSDSQSPTPATASKSFTIDVAYLPLQITTGALPDGQYVINYNQTLTATGGNRTYAWSISSGSLPEGLSLNSANGIISGTPIDVGRFTITVQVTDGQTTPATAFQTYSFNIANGVMQRSAEYPTIDGCGTSLFKVTGSTTNMVTGAIANDQEVFAVKGTSALGTAIELYYKSLPVNNGPLGPGWSHNYNIFLTANSDGSIVLQDGSGSKSFYTKSGSSYVSPPGDFSTLIQNGDGSYTITYRDGHRYNFSQNGKITFIVDRYNNAISFAYTNGDLTAITDPAQRTTTISYDQTTAPHRISTITDPNQNVYNFSYQGNTLYRVINPAADTNANTVRGYWEYAYDPQGFLISKKDPNGNTSQYTYYSDHRMWKAIDPEGQTRAIVYPAATGNLRTSTLTEKDEGQWLYTYDAQYGVLKQKTDPNGNAISYTYYPNGFLKSKTEPKDGTVSLTTFYTYDSYGNVLTQTDPADLNSYSPAINPETVADPSTLASLSPPIKPAFAYSYDTNNYDRITSVSDQRGATPLTTTIGYATENAGDVVTVTAPGDASNTNIITTTKYNPNGTVKQIIDANQKSTVFTYYPDTTANRAAGIVGLLNTTTDPAGITTSVNGYDNNGNPVTAATSDTTNTVRLTLSQQYDFLNRLRQLTKSTATLPATTTNYSYDLIGNLATLTDPQTRQTNYLYNYNGKVTKITDAKQNDTVFTYSSSGCGSCGAGVDKVIGVYDATVSKNMPLTSQPHTAYSYDQLGRLAYETDPLGKKIHYTYYDNGLLKTKADATTGSDAVLVTYLYDNLDHLTDKNFTDGTYEHYGYYPNGRLQTAANQNISYTYTWYDDGRLQSVTDTTNNRTISYDQYDGLGQRKQMTVLSGTPDQRVISYDYDSANRPWHITSSVGTFTYSYDNLGRRSTITYPNQTTVSYGYDDLNRLTSLNNSVTNGAVFAGFSYTSYDMAGNRTSVSGNKNESYLYDEIYRLLTVTATKPESFNYDVVGNRQTGPSPVDTSYLYNNANQMTQGRKLGYGYDNFGNQTTKTVPGATDKNWVQTWDNQNRLVKVEKIKGAERRTVTFTYDPLGRRIGKQMTIVKDGVTQTQSWSYVCDGDNILVEIYTDENNTTTKTFYTQGPGIDEHLALERNGQFYYYHADGLGSIATITDAAHAVVQSYEYDSYGMVTPSTNFRNSYTYTGREWDPEAGLYYYRARFYDPVDGRFIQKDPIGIVGGINVYAYVDSVGKPLVPHTPQTNLYEYAGNNPINNTDPLGLFEVGPNLSVSFNQEWNHFYNKLRQAAYNAGQAANMALGALATMITRDPKKGYAAYELSQFALDLTYGETTDLPLLPPFLQPGLLNPPDAHGRCRK